MTFSSEIAFSVSDVSTTSFERILKTNIQRTCLSPLADPRGLQSSLWLPWATKGMVDVECWVMEGMCAECSESNLVILEMWQGSRNLCLCLSNSDMKHWKALRGRCSQQYQWNPRVGAINGNQNGLLSKIYNLQTNMDSWALLANSRSQCLPYSLPCPASHLLPVFTSMWNKWSFIYNWLHFIWLALPPISKVAMGSSP